jgi:transcriptional regulator with XRE-family HTH domain
VARRAEKTEYDDLDLIAIGRRIREVRERLGLVQQDLADAAGVRHLAISELETGKTDNPKSRTLVAIANRLGVPLQWMLYGTTGARVDAADADDVPPADYAERVDRIVAEIGGVSDRVRAKLIHLVGSSGDLDDTELQTVALSWKRRDARGELPEEHVSKSAFARRGKPSQ